MVSQTNDKISLKENGYPKDFFNFINEMPHIKIKRPDGTYKIKLCKQKYSPLVIMILKKLNK